MIDAFWLARLRSSGERSLNSIFAFRAATGVVVNFDKRSLSSEADRFLEAAESARPGSIFE